MTKRSRPGMFGPLPHSEPRLSAVTVDQQLGMLAESLAQAQLVIGALFAGRRFPPASVGSEARDRHNLAEAVGEVFAAVAWLARTGILKELDVWRACTSRTEILERNERHRDREIASTITSIEPVVLTGQQPSMPLSVAHKLCNVTSGRMEDLREAAEVIAAWAASCARNAAQAMQDDCYDACLNEERRTSARAHQARKKGLVGEEVRLSSESMGAEQCRAVIRKIALPQEGFNGAALPDDWIRIESRSMQDRFSDSDLPA